MSADLLAPVLADLARVIGATTPDQDHLPTPCDGMDVVSLRRHLLGGLPYFTLALSDPDGDERPDPRAYTGPEGRDVLVAAIEELSKTAEAALAGGVETVPVKVPHLGGTFPGDMVISMLFAEVIVHGWDTARATGQAWQPAPAASERAHALLTTMVQPQLRGGAGMPFAPEVPVAADAPALDRLLGFAGRSPDWAPRS